MLPSGVPSSVHVACSLILALSVVPGARRPSAERIRRPGPQGHLHQDRPALERRGHLDRQSSPRLKLLLVGRQVEVLAPHRPLRERDTEYTR